MTREQLRGLAIDALCVLGGLVAGWLIATAIR